VSEASEDEIRWAATLSQRRTSFLDWAIAVLEGGVVVGREFPAFVAFTARTGDSSTDGEVSEE
jgi:hypothetical protein